MRPVAVFDTNVLFSAVGWKGKPYQCLELARTGFVEGITCQEILVELAESLRDKLGLSPKQIADAVADLLGFLSLVAIANTVTVVAADPDDDKVLECAAVATATHIVTGDHVHLLPLGSFQNIPIVTPAEFLSIVAGIRAPHDPRDQTQDGTNENGLLFEPLLRFFPSWLRAFVAACLFFVASSLLLRSSGP